jgi:serine/threonine protein kinase
MSKTHPSLPSIEEIHASNDILYELGTVKVVRIGDKVVKYGDRVQLGESDTMKFVANKTSIPIPEVFGAFEHEGKVYICMSRVDGRCLDDCLSELKTDEIMSIASELSGFVTQLRTIEGANYIGSLHGGPCRDHLWNYNEDLPRGPFESESQLNDTLTALYHDRYQGNFNTFLRSLYRDNHCIVFTHGDLTPRNIMVSEGRIVAIIDWEFAGWYPEYWEYVKSLYGDSWRTNWPLFIDKLFPSYHYELMVHNILYAALT